MRRLAALLTIALPLLWGCGTRAHLNPFDPENPETGGRPAGFEALAGNQSVLLRWQTASARGLIGYQVFRLAPGDTGFRAITGVLPPVRASHTDFGLANGKEHRYRLYFVFAHGLGGRPAEDVATPGPLRPWVADYFGDRLVRLSADGRHVAESLSPAGLGHPAAVDVNSANGEVWACGPDGGVLVHDPYSGSSRIIGEGLSEPVSVIVDRTDSTAWVGDGGSNAVLHLRSSGLPADPPVLTGLAYPGGLALDRSNGSLWVVEQDGDRVRRYAAGGALAATAAVSRPSRVAADPGTHEAWVTSFDRGLVVRLSPAGAPLDTVTACSGPIGIAVDAHAGRIWVADALGDQVVALSRAGTVEFRVTEQREPFELALDEATGEAWVTLAAAGAVARLSPQGREVLRVGGLSGPYGIALDDLSGRVYARATGAGRISAPPRPSR